MKLLEKAFQNVSNLSEAEQERMGTVTINKCYKNSDYPHSPASDAITYTCPMHPNVKQDKQEVVPNVG